MDKLLFLDIYGLEPKLFFNKQAKYRSYLGLLATIITVCLTGLFAFLFGTDFFYRSNPIVISQEKILEKSPVIYATGETFPMFFSVLVGNDPLQDMDNFPISFYFHYSYLKREDEGKLTFIHDVTIKPKKCSKTSAKDNPLMANYNLDEMFCLDWEELGEIIGEPPRIGGTFDENEFTIYRFTVDNCKLDFPKYICKSYSNLDEIQEVMGKEISVATYYPSYHLEVDSLDNPVIQSFESKPYNLSSSVFTIERRTFELSVFEDDIGWIFKNTQIYEVLKENKFESETQINSKERKRFYFYALISYLGRRTTVIRRRFMKIQELMAMVGGFLKLITLVSQTIIAFLGGFKMNLIIAKKTKSKFFKEKEVLKDNLTPNKSVLPLSKSKNSPINLTLWQYLMSFCKFSSNKEVEKYNTIVEELKKKLDIISLIDMQEKINTFEVNQANKGRDML